MAKGPSVNPDGPLLPLFPVEQTPLDGIRAYEPLRRCSMHTNRAGVRASMGAVVAAAVVGSALTAPMVSGPAPASRASRRSDSDRHCTTSTSCGTTNFAIPRSGGGKCCAADSLSAVSSPAASRNGTSTEIGLDGVPRSVRRRTHGVAGGLRRSGNRPPVARLRRGGHSGVVTPTKRGAPIGGAR